MRKTIKFYDTSALLDKELEECDFFYISYITLLELENIKNSFNKSEEIKYKARRITEYLDTHPLCYEVKYELEFFPNTVVVDNDIDIICTALYCQKHEDNDIIFITNDLFQKNIAKIVLLNVISEEIKKDDYTGYINKYLSEEELANLYTNPQRNSYNLLTNQYLNVYNKTGEYADSFIWNGKELEPVKYKIFSSKHFGDIKPKKDDIEQKLAFDAISRNQLTVFRGKSGSGKSFIALAYLFDLLEKNKIDRIIIFCNTVAVRGAARLG